jgi:outer membrane receptor protein involved in Fe transport
MKKLFLVCLLPLALLRGYAQSVTGNVQESDGKPLPFANVLLLSSKDSSLVKGAIADQAGAYSFEHIRPGTYLLAATMVGYQRVYAAPLLVAPGQAGVQVPVLTLSPDTRRLEEVTVTTTRPFVEQQIDRTVVNVAGSIIAGGSTALEVLEKAPGVTVDRQNDAIALRGKEGVIVMMDGKQTYLSMADVVALLRSMPSDDIDRIELITNPSAKYDAAGNSGIINIRMKKNNNAGTNGSLSLAAGSGRYDRERGSVQLNHRGRKLTLFTSYGANQGGSYWNFNSYRDWSQDGERNVVQQSNYLHFLDWGHNGKAGVDYQVGKNTTLGAAWTGQWGTHRQKGPTDTQFRTAEAGPVYLHTHTDKTWYSASANQVGNLNVQHTFGPHGGQLSADADAGRFRRRFTNELFTETVPGKEDEQPAFGLLTRMPTAIDILTLKTDYHRTLPGDWKLETGLKYSSVRSDNDMRLEKGEAGHLVADPELSNHFRYTERVGAAYADFSGTLGQNTQVQAGLRAEHTHSLAHSLTLDNRVRRKYLDLFPSLFLSRTLTKDHLLAFSYSYRIDRPNYQNLNPARGYIDPYAFSRGNPYLKPQYTHSLELKHGFAGKIHTSLGVSYSTDLVFFLIQPVDVSRFERTPENVGSSRAYNLTVSFPVTLARGWTLQTTLMGVYSDFRYTYLEQALTARQLSGRLNGTSAFVLGKGWTAELSGWLRTPGIDVLIRSPWLGSLDAGLQKTLGAQWKVKLSVQDLFHSNQVVGNIDAGGFTNRFRIGFDTRVALLNLSCNFGNQQLTGTRQRKTGSEEETKRTN